MNKKLAEKLRTTWSEMAKYGTHEGNCDNIETCEKCGSRLHACSLHLETVQKRHIELEETIQEVLSFLET